MTSAVLLGYSGTMRHRQIHVCGLAALCAAVGCHPGGSATGTAAQEPTTEQSVIWRLPTDQANIEFATKVIELEHAKQRPSDTDPVELNRADNDLHAAQLTLKMDEDRLQVEKDYDEWKQFALPLSKR